MLTDTIDPVIKLPQNLAKLYALTRICEETYNALSLIPFTIDLHSGKKSKAISRHTFQEVVRKTEGILAPIHQEFPQVYRHLPLKESSDFVAMVLAESPPQDRLVGMFSDRNPLQQSLQSVRVLCYEAIEAMVVDPVKKAEHYLQFYSLGGQVINESEQEALVYLRSRRKNMSIHIASRLIPCWAESQERVLTESSLSVDDISRSSPYALRDFWTGLDQEELVIDATMLRTADWCKVPGFDKWWNRWARDTHESLLHGGIENFVAFSVFLFSLLRCDKAIELLGEDQLSRAILALSVGETSRNEPWIQSFSLSEKTDKAPCIPIASTLVFGACRLSIRTMDDLVSRALRFLESSQKRDGGWRWWNFDKRQSIGSTAMAIHAFSLARPNGWQEKVAKAREWLLAQQRPFGNWREEGALGLSDNVTVLTLDSIALSKGETSVTFHASRHIDSTRDPIYNYSGCDYATPLDPQTSNVHYDRLNENEKVVDVVVVVATPTERKQTTRLMQPLSSRRAVLLVWGNKEDYYLGMFGKHRTTIVQCEMSDDGKKGSTLVIHDACMIWKPRAVLLVGIAFAADKSTQGPADLMIGSYIYPYAHQRVERKHFKSRMPPVPLDGTLFSNMTSFSTSFSFMRPDRTTVEIHKGSILSAPFLMDDAVTKKKLIDMARKVGLKDVVGGEMEGVGLVSSGERDHVPTALVKGVSDWGDGKKRESDYQNMAAAAAAKFVHEFLSLDVALDGL